MRIEAKAKSREQRETQLRTIRDLMVVAAARGAWLTLNEIAERTEFGEASISAQLRHLRKECDGNYRVEKRPRRQVRPEPTAGCAVCQGAIWEYRVIPPESAMQRRREAGVTSRDSNAPEPGRDACQNA